MCTPNSINACIVDRRKRWWCKVHRKMPKSTWDVPVGTWYTYMPSQTSDSSKTMQVMVGPMTERQMHKLICDNKILPSTPCYWQQTWYLLCQFSFYQRRQIVEEIAASSATLTPLPDMSSSHQGSFGRMETCRKKKIQDLGQAFNTPDTR